MKMDEYFYKSIGEQINRARTARKWSLQDLSDRIGGYKSKQTLMRYERGEIRIDPNAFEKICAALSLDQDLVIERAKNSDPEVIAKKMAEVVNETKDITPAELTDRAYETIHKYLSCGVQERGMIDRLVDDLYETSEMFRRIREFEKSERSDQHGETHPKEED